MLFDSGQAYDGRAFRDCMHEAATHGVQMVRPQRGYLWSDDDVTFDILAPSMPVLADTGDDINENSIVAILSYNNFRELFMGDAGEASEGRLLASGTDLHADVPMFSKLGTMDPATRQRQRLLRPSVHASPSSPSAATTRSGTQRQRRSKR